MNNKYKRSLILVNIITGIRVIGSFLLLPIYYLFGPFYTGLVTIIFLGTDWLDGFLARKLKVSTFFGALFDGMSDKLFNLVALIILGIMNHMMLIPVIMELIILITGYDQASRGNHVGTSKVGKVKTLIFDLAFIMTFLIYGINDFSLLFNLNIVMNLNTQNILITIITLIVIAFETITLIDYLFKDKNQNMIQRQFIHHDKKVLKSKDELWQLLLNHDFYVKHKDDDIRDIIYVKDEMK